MNKKRVIITFILLSTLTIFSIFVHLATHNSGKISNILSQRSRDFIQKQQKDDSSKWQQFSLKDEPLNSNSQTPIYTDINTPCFSFTIPFKVVSENLAEKCDINIHTDAPKATVVVFTRNVDIETISDVPDIRLRLQNTEEYAQQENTTNNYEFMIFKNTSMMYEKTAFYFEDDTLFAITLKSNYSSNLDKQFSEILDTVKLN